MKTILLAPNQLEYAKHVGMKRLSNKYKIKTYGVPNSVLGAIGEYAFSLHSGMPFDDNIYKFGDGGADFPDGTDVKTSSFTGQDVELKVSKKYNNVRRYVLAQYNEKVNTYAVKLVGEISYENFWKKCKAKKYNQGKETYVVSFKDLDIQYK